MFCFRLSFFPRGVGPGGASGRATGSGGWRAGQPGRADGFGPSGWLRTGRMASDRAGQPSLQLTVRTCEPTCGSTGTPTGTPTGGSIVPTAEAKFGPSTGVSTVPTTKAKSGPSTCGSIVPTTEAKFGLPTAPPTALQPTQSPVLQPLLQPTLPTVMPMHLNRSR